MIFVISGIWIWILYFQWENSEILKICLLFSEMAYLFFMLKKCTFHKLGFSKNSHVVLRNNRKFHILETLHPPPPQLQYPGLKHQPYRTLNVQFWIFIQTLTICNCFLPIQFNLSNLLYPFAPRGHFVPRTTATGATGNDRPREKTFVEGNPYPPPWYGVQNAYEVVCVSGEEPLVPSPPS